MYKVCLENAIITGLVISNKKVHAQHTPHAIQSVKEVYILITFPIDWVPNLLI